MDGFNNFRRWKKIVVLSAFDKHSYNKTMNKNITLILRAGLLIIAAFLVFKIYRVVMEPIEFERIKNERYAEVIDRLEDIRDAQKLYKQQYLQYEDNLNDLIGFIDTGYVDIVERKDSSFMYYNELYRQDMMKDTTIYRVIGRESVRDRLFSDTYDAERLRYIPYSEEEFWMDATTINKNGVTVAVFQAAAEKEDFFGDLIEKGQYSYFIDKVQDNLAVGSLTEPTLSGNWK